MRSHREREAGPLLYAGEVKLARAHTFYYMDQLSQQQTRHLIVGDRVRVREAERIIDDHGRFDRWWYRAEIPGTWFKAVLEEDCIEPPRTSAVDRLGALARDKGAEA